ncbi:MAG TPA: hypothetical protein VIM99_11100 [Blastocatellia bacterium]
MAKEEAGYFDVSADVARNINCHHTEDMRIQRDGRGQYARRSGKHAGAISMPERPMGQSEQGGFSGAGKQSSVEVLRQYLNGNRVPMRIDVINNDKEGDL